MVARVLPDVAAIAKTFDYTVPAALAADVAVGTMVRVRLGGRRVGGWVVALPAAPATDRPLQPLAKVTGRGPSAELVELASWAAWRWAGRPTAFLRTASPARAVRALPAPSRSGPAVPPGGGQGAELAVDAFARPRAVVRVPPAEDLLAFALEAARRDDPLVLVPSLAAAAFLAARLRRAGVAVALVPEDWARAAAGGCVAVGARAGAWAPRPRLGAVLVLDEGDEAYQEGRSPTWNARDVAAERARRAGAPCVLTSACPSLESLAAAELMVPSRELERRGWPVVEVVDRREEAPGLGLWSPRLVAAVRAAVAGERVACVLNRRGRSRLLACGACRELARCEACAGAVGEDGDGVLACRRCGTRRPVVCLQCGSTRVRVLRAGVTRAREELELLAGQTVAEVTAGTAGRGAPPPAEAVLVGTEAVLHRIAGARVVAFVDFDQELLAPRYRAGEEALALLARAARLVGGRDGGGRVLVQTRLPSHEVLEAAAHADPSRFAVVEAARRAALRLPPEVALAVVSGEGAAAYLGAIPAGAGLEVLGPSDGRWLVRADDHRTLCGALAAAPRPPGRLRVEVDPLRA